MIINEKVVLLGLLFLLPFLLGASATDNAVNAETFTTGTSIVNDTGLFVGGVQACLVDGSVVFDLGSEGAINVSAGSANKNTYIHMLENYPSASHGGYWGVYGGINQISLGTILSGSRTKVINIKYGGGVDSENVGIGSINPTAKLTVNSTDVPLRLEKHSTDSIVAQFQTNISGGRVDLAFYNNSGGKMVYLGAHQNDSASTEDHFHIKTANSSASMITRFGIDIGDDVEVGISNADFDVNDNDIENVNILCVNGAEAESCTNNVVKISGNTVITDSASGGSAGYRWNENGAERWRLYYPGTSQRLLLDETVASDSTVMAWENTGEVGVGVADPVRTLDVKDYFRINGVSSAPSSPALGDVYVDSDTSEFCFYNSTAWVGLQGRSCA